jgi:predicted transcriptional regulator
MKARITITVEQELQDRINAEAARQRRSTSNLIEVIIEDYLDRVAQTDNRGTK